MNKVQMTMARGFPKIVAVDAACDAEYAHY